MKVLFFTCILFIWLVLEVKADSDLLIFNTDGNVSITRDNNSLDELQGKKFLEGDVLHITDGSITIINKNNKRIAVDKPGTYKYDDVDKLMQKAEASLTNRYFVLVWKKMNKESEQVNKPGGVVRGEEFETLPLDSVIILSDSIEFQIPNKSDLEYSLIIKSEKYKELVQYDIWNSLKVNIQDISNGKPGKYYWEIKFPFGKGPDTKYFIIPDSSTYNKLINEYNDALGSFSVFDDKLRKSLMEEYKKFNKVYL